MMKNQLKNSFHKRNQNMKLKMVKVYMFMMKNLRNVQISRKLNQNYIILICLMNLLINHQNKIQIFN